MKIVNTDNYGSDYPDEKFLNIHRVDTGTAKKICDALNENMGENSPRFYKIVDNDYKLIGGFEP